ncbi:MAG TPA: arsenate reductase ArsC [Candidatus Eisenbacteria bacterium]|nr:arsenate reductase ArsC [Candidatus Eisenbacteria bacterium]
MSDRPIRVLFVCTGNSARSQMAEAILRRQGGHDFEVFSAGVSPRPVHPLAIRVLAEIGLDISGARSKSTAPFVAQQFDYVVTLCDRARQDCPFFPGAHEIMHWGLDDPAEAPGSEEEQLVVFRRVMTEVAGRVRTFLMVARRAQAATPAAPRG